jgi:hypothetical protein
MNMMGIKKGVRVQRVLATVLAIGFTSSAASADVWAPGSVCTEGTAAVGNVLNFNGGLAANPSANEVYSTCPVISNQNLGTTHSFEVRVEDGHATQNFSSFIGLVIGTDGEIVSSSNSGQVSGTGELTMNFAATTGVASDDYSYVVLGNIPANSQLEVLHIF